MLRRYLNLRVANLGQQIPLCALGQTVEGLNVLFAFVHSLRRDSELQRLAGSTFVFHSIR